MSRLGSLAFLANEAPGFRLHGSQVKVLKEPGEFYETLCKKAAGSKQRIILASLYLGTGDLEHRLIESVGESFEKSGGKTRVKILLDFCRGNRLVNGQNSCTMVLPLMEKYKSSFELSLYHSPMLRGFKKMFMPARYDEIIGIQHCKAYVFDDTTIISGANLSQDYFTNRQDRYIIIENCPKLADYFEELVQEIQMFSFQAGFDHKTKKFEFTQGKNWKGGHPYQGKLDKFLEEGQLAIRNFLSNQKSKNSLKLVDDKFVPVQMDASSADNSFDTWIFPALQMGIFRIKQDCELTTKFMENAAKSSNMRFGTGYFNLTQDYLNVIMYKSPANYDLLMAHPKANGFLGAKGPAGGIPAAYTLIAKMFFDLLTKNRLHDRIKMFEYQKEGWTFHAKGLWYYPPHECRPIATLIGSPNFGYRSEERDLECQLTIVTENPNLQKDLHDEQARLFQDSTPVSRETFTLAERKIPTWVTWVVGLARNFF